MAFLWYLLLTGIIHTLYVKERNNDKYLIGICAHKIKWLLEQYYILCCIGTNLGCYLDWTCMCIHRLSLLNIMVTVEQHICWHWLIDWWVCWLIGWLTGLLIDYLIGWLVNWSTDWLINRLIRFIDWSIDRLIGLLIDWIIDWLITWLATLVWYSHAVHCSSQH